MIAIVGASGSGKSTLLAILGGMDVPSAGRAVVAGYDLGRMSNSDRTRFRRRTVGFVWQQTGRNLLPYLSAVDNVELPMVLDGRKRRRARALELLDLVGLADRAQHRPDRLSGGEQQRVAIAVALANDPSVILADEPTGELDSRTSAEVFGLLRRVNRETGHDDRDRDPRRVRVGAGGPHRGDPRRPDQQRDPSPHRADRRRASGHQRGVRGARPCRPAPAAACSRRGARAARTGSGCASRRTTWGCGPTSAIEPRARSAPVPAPPPSTPVTPGGAPMTERYARPGPEREAMVVASGLVRDYDERRRVVHALRGDRRCASRAASSSPSAAGRGAARPRSSTCSAASTGPPRAR